MYVRIGKNNNLEFIINETVSELYKIQTWKSYKLEVVKFIYFLFQWE